MVINNELSTRETGLWFTLVITFFTVTFLCSLLIEFAQVWWLQYPSAALVLITILIYRFGGYHFINASFSENAVEIKFYNLFPYGRKFRMIKIIPSQIKQIRILKGFMGIGRGVILYQNTGKSVAKYPYIGLSSINANDRNRILLHLQEKK